MTAKVTVNDTIYLLAIPSIITNSGVTDQILKVEENALSGTLLFNGKPLVDATKYNPNTALSGGVVYTTTGSISTISGSLLVNNLKTLYGSVPDIAGNSAIASLLTATDPTAIASLGTAIVNNQLGGKVSSSGDGTANENPQGSVAYDPTKTYLPGEKFAYGDATITSSGSNYGWSSTKADSAACDTNDIAVWTGSYFQIWAACNVGAKKAVPYAQSATVVT